MLLSKAVARRRGSAIVELVEFWAWFLRLSEDVAVEEPRHGLFDLKLHMSFGRYSEDIIKFLERTALQPISIAPNIVREGEHTLVSGSHNQIMTKARALSAA